MSNYTKSTDFASKDALLSGNPGKVITGTEIDTEFNNIATAVSTKADLASPTFIGTPTAPTAAGGTNSIQIATTAFVQAEIASDLTTERSASATLTNKTINLANNTLTGTTAEFNTALSDGNFATIAGTETLTNKTLTTPTLTTPKVNVINEETAGSGVTIDGVLIKDNEISGQYAPIFRETAKATTSGTSVDFSGIPSWVKRITIIFSDVSHNASGGNSNMLIQLGFGSTPGSNIETSGYASASFSSGGEDPSTAGFIIRESDTTGRAVSGIMTLVNISGNTWISGHTVRTDTTPRVVAGAGSKTITGGVLTQVRLTTVSGTPAFDAGSINIMYE